MRADHAQPLQRREDEMVGKGRGFAREVSLVAECGRQRPQHLAQRSQMRLAPRRKILQAASKKRLARGLEIILVLGVRHGLDLRQGQPGDRRVQRCLGPVIDEAGKVPVLVDAERCVADSWTIAEYQGRETRMFR